MSQVLGFQFESRKKTKNYDSDSSWTTYEDSDGDGDNEGRAETGPYLLVSAWGGQQHPLPSPPSPLLSASPLPSSSSLKCRPPWLADEENFAF